MRLTTFLLQRSRRRADLTREHQYAVAIKREKVAESREKQSLAALHAREPSSAARASGSGSSSTVS
jgi:hypothetical protein